MKDHDFVNNYRETIKNGLGFQGLERLTGYTRRSINRKCAELNLSTTPLGGRQDKISEEVLFRHYHEIKERNGNTDDLAKELNITPESVKYLYKKFCLEPLRKKRGGFRQGAGRPRNNDPLLAQLKKDQKINSYEVGLIRKNISKDGFYGYAGSAYKLNGPKYVRKINQPDLPKVL